MSNSGQSCNAPTRMFVPRAKQDQAMEIAKAAAAKVKVGDPFAEGTTMGPVVSEVQFNKIQASIQKGIDEGATLVTGGVGRPEGLEPRLLCAPDGVRQRHQRHDHRARRNLRAGAVDLALRHAKPTRSPMANDTVYGLSGYVQSGNIEHARNVAAQLRTGNVHLNGAGADFKAPFGGYKQSGNGREWGEFGLRRISRSQSRNGMGGLKKF